MKCKLLGLKEVNFDNGKESIKGTNVWIAHKEKGVEGLTCTKFWITPEQKQDGTVNIDMGQFIGKEIDVSLNFKGKIESISA